MPISVEIWEFVVKIQLCRAGGVRAAVVADNGTGAPPGRPRARAHGAAPNWFSTWPLIIEWHCFVIYTRCPAITTGWLLRTADDGGLCTLTPIGCSSARMSNYPFTWCDIISFDSSSFVLRTSSCTSKISVSAFFEEKTVAEYVYCTVECITWLTVCAL